MKPRAVEKETTILKKLIAKFNAHERESILKKENEWRQLLGRPKYDTWGQFISESLRIYEMIPPSECPQRPGEILCRRYREAFLLPVIDQLKKEGFAVESLDSNSVFVRERNRIDNKLCIYEDTL